jgi:hypothetical protein
MKRHRHDPKLWVLLDSCCKAKHLLCNNSHSFPGRMSVYCPTHRLSLSASLGDFSKMSDESRYWIKGFLVGNTPPPPLDAEGDPFPEESAVDKAWRAKAVEFQKTGRWKRD